MEKFGGKNIQFELNGLQCDKCNWKNENIPFDEWDEWIDKPCPECGAIVLTHEQMGQVVMMMEIAEVVNELDIDIKPDDPIVDMNIKIDEDTNIKINIEDSNAKNKRR